MNDYFVRQCAAQFAQRVVNEAGEQQAAQVRRVFQLALGRPPSDSEQSRAEKFLASAADASGEGIPVEGMVDLCHAVFTLNEFLYVE
jgi:hypothetical protein